jgi:hypothetical protein
MNTTAVNGAYESVAELVRRYDPANIFIISKCGEEIERKTRLWLEGNRFYVRTGFRIANLHFCRTRAAKAPIAARLGLTDFVDDHAEVLAYMDGIVDRRYLFGPQTNRPNTAGLVVVRTWAEALHELRKAV